MYLNSWEAEGRQHGELFLEGSVELRRTLSRAGTRLSLFCLLLCVLRGWKLDPGIENVPMVLFLIIHPYEFSSRSASHL